MKWAKRIGVGLLALVLLAAAVVLMAGPWPLYSDSHYQETG